MAAAGPVADAQQASEREEELVVVGDAVVVVLEARCELLAKQSDVVKATAVAPNAPVKDPESRAREDLVHVLLNHNDFVTVR